MANKRNTADAALTQKREWGVPTWKSETGYPAKSDGADIWKWEFLRRTDAYRNDWERACATAPKTALKKPTSKKQSGFLVNRPFDKVALAKKYGMSRGAPPNAHYADLPEGFSFVRLPESSTGGDIIYPQVPIPTSATVGVTKQTKVPAKDVTKNDSTKSTEVLMEEDLARIARKMPTMLPTDWYGGRVWVEYDLGCSLDTQLQRADEALYEKQKQLKAFMKWLGASEDHDGNDYGALPVGARKQRGIDKKSDFKEMEKLLRIMDAKRCDVNNRAIAVGLKDLKFEHMDESTVSKNYKTALKLWKEL